MLLAIDIGNTSIKLATFNGGVMERICVVPTQRTYSTREFAEAVEACELGGINRALISSVVPEVERAVGDWAGGRAAEVRFVQSSDDLGLRFDQAREGIGSDRLVNSFAAAELFGIPVIVIAFGTATTIDVVDRRRSHLGGLIAPGPATAARALHTAASKLPEVEVVAPPHLINTTTVEAIQAGVFYSQTGLVEKAVSDIRREIGDDARVVATGGYASIIAPGCDAIGFVESDLTLRGLQMLDVRFSGS